MLMSKNVNNDVNKDMPIRVRVGEVVYKKCFRNSVVV